MADNYTAGQHVPTESDDAGTDPAEAEADADDGIEPGAEPATGTGTDTAATNGEAGEGEDEDGGGPLDMPEATSPLTIELPDGSESVSEAILSHRRMLLNPGESGLAAAEAVEDLDETVETLSREVTDGLQQQAKLDGSVEEMRAELDRQRRQIEELKQVTESLAEILGASTDWQTFENGADASGDET